MDEYIGKRAMLDAVEKLSIIPSIDGTGKPTPSEDFRVQFLGTVLKVPAADVVPVRHGKWKKIGVWGRVYRCSQCGNILDFDAVNAGRGDANFCPNCGAKMKGKEKR